MLMPYLDDLNGRKALFVNGKPHIILGLQWDCDACYSPLDAEIVSDHFTSKTPRNISEIIYNRLYGTLQGDSMTRNIDKDLFKWLDTDVPP
jgi:hypothetical protein